MIFLGATSMFIPPWYGLCHLPDAFHLLRHDEAAREHDSRPWLPGINNPQQMIGEHDDFNGFLGI